MNNKYDNYNDAYNNIKLLGGYDQVAIKEQLFVSFIEEYSLLGQDTEKIPSQH